MTPTAPLFRRFLLACAALALLASGPAMAGMARSSPGPVAHRHPGHVPAPGSHPQHAQCCDLCIVHCASVLGSDGTPPSPTDVAPVVAVGLRVGPSEPWRAPVRYRIPPALAPPLLLG